MITVQQFDEIVRNYMKFTTGVSSIEQVTAYTAGMLDVMGIIISGESALMPSALKALTSSAMDYPAEVKSEAFKVVAELDRGDMEESGALIDLTAILAPYSSQPDIAAQQFLRAAHTMIG